MHSSKLPGPSVSSTFEESVAFTALAPRQLGPQPVARLEQHFAADRRPALGQHRPQDDDALGIAHLADPAILRQRLGDDELALLDHLIHGYQPQFREWWRCPASAHRRDEPKSPPTFRRGIGKRFHGERATFALQRGAIDHALAALEHLLLFGTRTQQRLGILHAQIEQLQQIDVLLGVAEPGGIAGGDRVVRFIDLPPPRAGRDLVPLWRLLHPDQVRPTNPDLRILIIPADEEVQRLGVAQVLEDIGERRAAHGRGTPGIEPHRRHHHARRQRHERPHCQGKHRMPLFNVGRACGLPVFKNFQRPLPQPRQRRRVGRRRRAIDRAQQFCDAGFFARFVGSVAHGSSL